MGFLRDKSVMLTDSATGLNDSFTGDIGTDTAKFLVGEFGERQLQAAIPLPAGSRINRGGLRVR